jgi:hypothetical protein
MQRLKPKRRRREIFVEQPRIKYLAPSGATSRICRSVGAWYFKQSSYKDFAPTTLVADFALALKKLRR